MITTLRQSVVQTFKEYFRPLQAKIGLGILVAILVFIFGGTLLYPYKPSQVVGLPFSPPSASHLLGTDFIGHDVMSQLIWGAYPSLLIAFYATTGATLIGLFAGILAGYFDRLESIIGGVTDVLLSIPHLPLLILLGEIFLGAGDPLIATFIMLVLWAPIARAVRAQTRSVRRYAYVDAARTSGYSDVAIVRRIVLPEVAPVGLVYFILGLSGIIIITTSLEFLGVGNPLVVSWGSLLYWAQQYAFAQGAWWWIIPPGAVIAIVSIGLYLLGFSVEQIVNPRLRS